MRMLDGSCWRAVIDLLEHPPLPGNLYLESVNSYRLQAIHRSTSVVADKIRFLTVLHNVTFSAPMQKQTNPLYEARWVMASIDDDISNPIRLVSAILSPLARHV